MRKEYYTAHKQEILAKRKAYHQLHKAEINEARRTRYPENAEMLKKKAKEYADNHKTEYAEQQRIYKQKLKLEVLGHYSVEGHPSCLHCTEDDLDMLCLDHINNDGTQHRRSINRQAGTDFYLWLRRNKYPGGFQVLCYNCNMKKQREHQRTIRR